MKGEILKNKKPYYKRWWVLVLIGWIGLSLLGAIMDELKEPASEEVKEDAQKAKNQLEIAQNELKKNEGELEEIEGELIVAKKEIKKNKNILKETESKLKKSEESLKKVNNNLKDTTDKLEQSETKVNKLEIQLKVANARLEETSTNIKNSEADANPKDEKLEIKTEEEEEFDSIAYELLTREEGKRNGNPEYIYGGFSIGADRAEMYGYTTTPITNEDDKNFHFWRYDVDFTPEKGLVILVKYPKGNHDKYIDIELIHDPIGEPNGDWNW
ncbi:hypothetical protein ACQKM1_15650 [Peribacillus frigoritolerans]|uniref:hypothetical protein n=1 Tax=Peribacillus frigoritolerans TaxID=450367 RepID=UPI003D07AE25